MGIISKLDAVNHMLLLAGESMVSDLDNNSGLDTETAEFCLDQFIRDFQMRGLASNRYLKKYTLTSKGRISLPNDCISAELISHHNNDDNYRILGVAKGETSKHLWNVTDQTDQWDKDVEFRVELIVTIAWENMDTPVQRAILSSAARQYQFVTQGDADTDSYLGSLEGLYMAKGKGADWDDRRRTIFDAATPKLTDALSRRGPLHDATVLKFWRTTNG
tara:strand:+ start:474 stop:1130 length:657 start_codon:yes stop_codon:yes gene_type:complete